MKTPAHIAISEDEIKRRAQKYIDRYSFACRVRHYMDCDKMHSMGMDDLMPNSEEIDKEMEMAGYVMISSQKEYERLCAEHGSDPLGILKKEEDGE